MTIKKEKNWNISVFDQQSTSIITAGAGAGRIGFWLDGDDDIFLLPPTTTTTTVTKYHHYSYSY